MNIEQAKENLTILRLSGRATNETNKALDVAIKSLKMWDKFSNEIPHLLDKKYVEIEDKYSDDLAEGFFQSEKIIKRRIREIKKEIEECK